MVLGSRWAGTETDWILLGPALLEARVIGSRSGSNLASTPPDNDLSPTGMLWVKQELGLRRPAEMWNWTRWTWGLRGMAIEYFSSGFNNALSPVSLSPSSMVGKVSSLVVFIPAVVVVVVVVVGRVVRERRQNWVGNFSAGDVNWLVWS